MALAMLQNKHRVSSFQKLSKLNNESRTHRPQVSVGLINKLFFRWNSLVASFWALSLPLSCLSLSRRLVELGSSACWARQLGATGRRPPFDPATRLLPARRPQLSNPQQSGPNNPPPVSWTNSWSDRQPILRQNFQRQFRPAPFWCRRALHAVRGRTWDFLLKTSPNIKLQQPMHKLIIA